MRRARENKDPEGDKDELELAPERTEGPQDPKWDKDGQRLISERTEEPQEVKALTRALGGRHNHRPASGPQSRSRASAIWRMQDLLFFRQKHGSSPGAVHGAWRPAGRRRLCSWPQRVFGPLQRKIWVLHAKGEFGS